MKIQLKRSSVLESGLAKRPSVAQMEYGELALNYNASFPTLFYKDSSNTIRDIELDLFPNTSNASLQTGTLDDRYLTLSGGTLTGTLTGTTFIGGVARISATPPTATASGELWYNTDDGRTYIYYQDADSAQWVDAAPDTYDLTNNYFNRTQSDSRYLQLGGDTATGTINFNNLALSATFAGPINFSATNNIVMTGASHNILEINTTTTFIHGGTSGIKFRNSSNNNDIFTINDTGAVVAAGTITQNSDINLKKNIEVIPEALEKVCSVRGVTFDRRDMAMARQTGVIAQEIEAVLPEAVVTDPIMNTKSVAYGQLVGLLIEAVKELKAEVDDLKS